MLKWTIDFLCGGGEGDLENEKWESKIDEGDSWEIKLWEVGEQGTGSRRF